MPKDPLAQARHAELCPAGCAKMSSVGYLPEQLCVFIHSSLPIILMCLCAWHHVGTRPTTGNNIDVISHFSELII